MNLINFRESCIKIDVHISRMKVTSYTLSLTMSRKELIKEKREPTLKNYKSIFTKWFGFKIMKISTYYLFRDTDGSHISCNNKLNLYEGRIRRIQLKKNRMKFHINVSIYILFGLNFHLHMSSL